MPIARAKMKILLILAKTLEKQELNFSRSALFHMKTRVSLRYFMNDCSYLFLFLTKALGDINATGFHLSFNIY